MKEVPKYYKYMIIFRGDLEVVQPIIGIHELKNLRLTDNKELLKLKNLTDLCTKLCTKTFEAMKALCFTVF